MRKTARASTDARTGLVAARAERRTQVSPRVASARRRVLCRDPACVLHGGVDLPSDPALRLMPFAVLIVLLSPNPSIRFRGVVLQESAHATRVRSFDEIVSTEALPEVSRSASKNPVATTMTAMTRTNATALRVLLTGLPTERSTAMVANQSAVPMVTRTSSGKVTEGVVPHEFS